MSGQVLVRDALTAYVHSDHHETLLTEGPAASHLHLELFSMLIRRAFMLHTSAVTLENNFVNTLYIDCEWLRLSSTPGRN